MAAVYVHIPFCSSKCHYCAFSVVTDQQQQEAYTEELLREAAARLDGSPVDTLYIGGGTPSLLRQDLLEKLLQQLPPAQEVTVECNPEQVTAELLTVMKDLGVTRISMGIQTLDNTALTSMNRQHTSLQAHQAMEALATSGLSWNADTILGLPGVDATQQAADIEAILAYAPHHFSAYFLSVEPGTVLASMKLPPESDAVVEMYEHLCTRLEAAGFDHTEISNWSLPGHACRHNMHYWHADDYTGLGLSASSLETDTIWTNTRNLQLYLQGQWRSETPITLDREDRIHLFLTSSTRLREGLAWSTLEALCTTKELAALRKAVHRLQTMGLLLPAPERIVLTESAFPLHNAILRDLSIFT